MSAGGKRKWPKAAAALGAAAILAAAAFAVATASRTGFVVAYGIVAYRTARWALLAAAGACAAASAAITVRAAVARGRAAKAEKAKSIAEAIDARERERALRKTGALSFRKEMRPEDVRAILLEEMDGEWAAAAGAELALCESGFEELDEDRKKLRELLDMNDAANIERAEDALTFGERAACKSARKALNYLSVLDPDSPADAAEAREKTREAAATIAGITKKARGFLMEVTELLNGQADGYMDEKQLEAYSLAFRQAVTVDSPPSAAERAREAAEGREARGAAGAAAARATKEVKA